MIMESGVGGRMVGRAFNEDGRTETGNFKDQEVDGMDMTAVSLWLAAAVYTSIVPWYQQNNPS